MGAKITQKRKGDVGSPGVFVHSRAIDGGDDRLVGSFFSKGWGQRFLRTFLDDFGRFPLGLYSVSAGVSLSDGTRSDEGNWGWGSGDRG